MYWLQRTLTPQIPDKNLRRQGLMVVMVSSALALLALFLGVTSALANPFSFATMSALIGILIYGACGAIARSGMVRPPAYVLIWLPWLIITVQIVMTPNPITVFFLAIPLLLAGILISSMQILPVLVASIVAVVYAMSQVDSTQGGIFFVALLFDVMLATLSFLSAWSVERTFQVVDDAQRALQQTNEALYRANSELESRVVQRTTDLHESLRTLQERERALQQTLDELRSSEETIRDLSAPILPIAAGVLVAPIVGAVDSVRTRVLMSSVLSTVAREGARYLILDVTGIPVIDTHVAQVLLQTASAVKLLGAQVILTGIRPEVAQTLVQLGVDLRSIVTRGTLESGIAEAVRH